MLASDSGEQDTRGGKSGSSESALYLYLLDCPVHCCIVNGKIFLYVYGQFLEHIDVPKRIKAVTQEYTVVGEGHTGMKQSKGRQVLLVVVAVGAVRATMQGVG